MLRVAYTGGDAPRRWRIDLDDVTVSEAEAIERAMGPGGSWEDFVHGVESARPRARRVLLWHLLKREHPELPFADAPDFRMGELTVEMGAAELERLREQIESNDRVPEARKAALLARVDAEYAAAVLDEAADEQAATDQGKAPASASSLPIDPAVLAPDPSPPGA